MPAQFIGVVIERSYHESICCLCALQIVELNHYQELRAPLLALMEENHIRGTLLLAQEGINGTVASSRQGIDALLAWLENEPSLKGTVYKESSASEPPFNRTKVKLKKRS